MNAALLKRLLPVTPEEQAILDGRPQVNKQLYTAQKDFTIDSAKMLQAGELISIRTHTRFVHFPRHRHNYIEMIYMCAGETTHIVNDQDRVTLHQGELLFLNQHAYHEILPARREDVAVNFMVLPQFFDVAFHMIENDSIIGSFLVSALRRDGGGQYLHFQVSQVPMVQNLVENLIWSLVDNRQGWQSINQYTMGLLFMQLLHCTSKLQNGGEEQQDSRLMMTVLRYVEGHYREGSLSGLARETGQSVYRLGKVIRHESGGTFKQLLQQKRLSVASSLLQTTQLPVLDVMDAVGYDNSSYFYRIFRARYGMSPREYRKAHSVGGQKDAALQQEQSK
ncbi:MAG TPA: helix-turn-helix domain-containing protein [Candidatus Gallacutalibacter stercoravium]|nr:helix-turn-helix domain-containing protein [Candidatus Gallacutalibacter stercoravium]